MQQGHNRLSNAELCDLLRAGNEDVFPNGIGFGSEISRSAISLFFEAGCRSD